MMKYVRQSKFYFHRRYFINISEMISVLIDSEKDVDQEDYVLFTFSVFSLTPSFPGEEKKRW